MARVRRIAQVDVRLTIEGCVSADEVRGFVQGALLLHSNAALSQDRVVKVAATVRTLDLARLRRRNRLLTKRDVDTL